MEVNIRGQLLVEVFPTKKNKTIPSRQMWPENKSTHIERVEIRLQWRLLGLFSVGNVQTLTS